MKFKNSISISIFMFSFMIKDFANWLNKMRFKRCLPFEDEKILICIYCINAKARKSLNSYYSKNQSFKIPLE